MNRFKTLLARTTIVGAIALAGAMSGPQAAMADDVLCTANGGVMAGCVDPLVATVDSLVPDPEGPILYCSPETGRCCSYNPRDPKGACVSPPPCEVDPSLCPPPGEAGE